MGGQIVIKRNTYCKYKVDFYYHLLLLLQRFLLLWFQRLSSFFFLLALCWLVQSIGLQLSRVLPLFVRSLLLLLFILHAARVFLLFYSARLIIYNTTGPGSTRLLWWSKRKENVAPASCYTVISKSTSLLPHVESNENPRNIKRWGERSWLGVVQEGNSTTWTKIKKGLVFRCSDETSQAKITRLWMLFFSIQ
jgi:hypothetical protein